MLLVHTKYNPFSYTKKNEKEKEKDSFSHLPNPTLVLADKYDTANPTSVEVFRLKALEFKAKGGWTKLPVLLLLPVVVTIL